MKKLIIVIFLSVFNFIWAQKEKSTKIGLATIEELKMNVYEKDSTAKAVVLYDHANVYIDPKNDYDFRTDLYKRIKIFDKSEEDRATIKIFLYKEQKVKDIKAVTYNLNGNLIDRVFLTEDKIFEKQVSENYKEVTFTLPNIKEGCVIEYQYSFISPYSRLKDWYFQEDIPKVKSDYTSAILGNWKYNVRIVGSKKLDRDNASVKKGCVYVPGIGNGSCAVLSYGMDNVPAFKEEAHMLSKENFISKLVFDLISYTNVEGATTKYTKTWKNADKTLRRNFLDGQTSKQNYFKKNLPLSVLNTQNELEKAKEVYKYIQDRMSWNEKYWTNKTIKVKEVFKQKTGSVDAINLVLYNSLKAAGIESYIVMVSTRRNGLPTRLYPVVNDFNYVIVKAVINDESYFLDATDDFLPFGEVPMRCLNGEGRVLDFDKGSFWELIKPRFKTTSRKRIELTYSPESGFTGKADFVLKGYYARKNRASLYNKTEDENLDAIETNYPDLEVENLQVKNEENYEKALNMSFDFTLDTSESLKFNPFFLERISKNPFKLKERNYPVDYGYPRSNSYLLNFKIPAGYKVKSLPKNKNISLPNKGGKYMLNVKQTETDITVYVKLSLNKKVFSSTEYHYLKEFYNQIIQSQKTLIKLEK